MFASSYLFEGSSVALISIFVFFAVVGELFFSTVLNYHKKYDNFKKMIFAVICILMSIIGVFMISEAMRIRKHVALVKNNVSVTLAESNKTRALAINHKNEIIAVSAGLLNKTGWDKNELIGNSAEDLIVNFKRQEFQKQIENYNDVWVLQENQVMSFKTKNGSVIKLPMTIVMCKLSQDKLLYNDDVLLLMLAEEKD
jgi:PAS domain S-box-containing protein